MPDTGFRRLIKYSFSKEIIESSTAPEEPVIPTDEIFYPVTSFPQDSDTFILSPNGKYILFGYNVSPV